MDETTTTDWYGPEVATFGDRVAAAREYAGMSQADLAKRLGVRLPTLRGWEDDLSEPRANRLSMLAGMLNVSMTWLITGVGAGVDSPDTRQPQSAQVNDILDDMRSLRAEMLRNAEAMGLLEKRLRQIMAVQANG